MGSGTKIQEQSLVSSKWIYKTKHSTYDNIQKYKERFVVRRLSLKEGIDYEETFALVARYTSIKTILSLVSKMK